MLPDYEIRWEHIFELDCEAINPDLRAFDQAFLAVEWLIATDPFRYAYEVGPDSPIWVLPILETKDLPAMYVSFAVEKEPPEGIITLLRAATDDDTSVDLIP